MDVPAYADYRVHTSKEVMNLPEKYKRQPNN